MFRLFVDSSQCKHIIFAGCHDAGYLSLITPHQGKSDRITLVKGAFWSKEFQPLRLPVIEFPSVFRSVPLTIENRSVPSQTSSSSARTEIPPFADVVSFPSVPATTQAATEQRANGHNYKTKPCTYFPLGKCKYGSKCIFIHPTSTDNDAKYEKKHLTTTSTNHPDTVAIGLPLADPLAKDNVPVNKDGQRIDTLLPPATTNDLAAFNARVSRPKFCNAYQLRRDCTNPDCSRDHSYVDPGIINIVRYLARRIPCRAGQACRDPFCYSGHHCSKKGCSPGAWCKFPKAMHKIDIQVTNWESQSTAVSRRHSPVSTISGENANGVPDSESVQGLDSEGVSLGEENVAKEVLDDD
jgi:CCCH-type zinc finger